MTDVVQRIAMKALIKNPEGKVLLVRVADTPKAGGNGGKYGLPGGKVKPGEVWSDALTREISEEVGLDIVIGQPFRIGEWRPVVQGTQLQIIGVFITCTTDDYDVKLSAENDKYIWAAVYDLEVIEVMEPDRQTALDYLTA